jgi:hypothetical protein
MAGKASVVVPQTRQGSTVVALCDIHPIDEQQQMVAAC